MHVENTSPAYRLHVELTKCDLADRLGSSFTKTLIVVMLEALHSDNVDMVKPFTGVVVNRCCGLVEAQVTSCFGK